MRSPLAFYNRRPPERKESSSTISSYEAEEQVNRHNELVQKQNSRAPALSSLHSNFLTRNQIRLDVTNCRGIAIGDTTHIYNTCYSNDCKNPAFILNNENLKLREKFLYVLSTRWCWGLIFLSLLLCTLSNIAFFFVLKPKPQIILVSRYGWGAGQSKEDLEALRLPAPRIITSHTGDEQDTCKNRADCIRRVKRMQLDYFGKGFDDIPWNFLVGGDGAIYEGRGFRFQGEIPINSTSSFIGLGYHVAFIGNFSSTEPNTILVDTFFNFLKNAVQREVLNADYWIFLEDQLTLGETVNGLLKVLGDNVNFYGMQHIWNRSQWKADPPKDPSLMEKFPADVERVNARKINVPFDCENLEECYTVVKNQQDYDFSIAENDIRYNFLIGDRGIFEGRGWDIQPPGNDSNSLSIGFFTNYLYQPDQLLNNTLIDLMRDGKALGKLSDAVKMFCEFQLCAEGP